ncbi:MAG: type II toxin-antitoxin system VapC family toxin [Rhodobacteraceae bacterium]|nr:type II toxin-antitoxin system VapC family toxin [Paracoccaceae bacterium]
MSAILDSSVLLALIFNEPGADVAAGLIATGARVGAVNLAEVATKLDEIGYSREDMDETLSSFVAAAVPFEAHHALAAGRLRRATRDAGLSLGDRACLAVAAAEGVAAVTADRAWGALDLGLDIEVIR